VGHLLGGEQFVEHLSAERGVGLDLGAFVGGERAGFEQDVVRDGDLADVVDERGVLEQRDALFGPVGGVGELGAGDVLNDPDRPDRLAGFVDYDVTAAEQRPDPAVAADRAILDLKRGPVIDGLVELGDPPGGEIALPAADSGDAFGLRDPIGRGRASAMYRARCSRWRARAGLGVRADSIMPRNLASAAACARSPTSWPIVSTTSSPGSRACVIATDRSVPSWQRISSTAESPAGEPTSRIATRSASSTTKPRFVGVCPISSSRR
jgi:hypothetical protein